MKKNYTIRVHEIRKWPLWQGQTVPGPWPPIPLLYLLGCWARVARHSKQAQQEQRRPGGRIGLVYQSPSHSLWQFKRSEVYHWLHFLVYRPGFDGGTRVTFLRVWFIACDQQFSRLSDDSYMRKFIRRDESVTCKGQSFGSLLTSRPPKK